MTIVEDVIAAETWPGLSQRLTIGEDVVAAENGHGCWSN